MSIWAVVIGVFFGIVVGNAVGLFAESLMDDELAKFERMGE